MTLFIVLLSVFVLAAVSYFLFRKHKTRSQIVGPQSTTQDPAQRPTQIVIGDDPHSPMVTIGCLDSNVEFERALPIDLRNGPMGRFVAMLQAAPSLLLAAEASGKQLMEVVIKGDMVQAAGGNGLRAFAVGPGGINEHGAAF